MMEYDLNVPYLASTGESLPPPLDRFLPECPPGVISSWLKDLAPGNSWVLDPFGSTPLTSIHAAKAGYRVLAAVNNPLLAFELQMLCQPPQRSDYQAALADLAASRRGDVSLETLIRSFYLTTCATCGREIQANGFIWKRNEKSPYARMYTCPHCGDSGVHPSTESDIERLNPLQRAEPLHRARALEKAIRPDMDEDERDNVEEALKNYTVRSLVVIFNLLNKLDAYSSSMSSKRMLQALLLPVLDAGTNLWPWPETSETPHLLQAPAEFVEKNLWMELEAAVDRWHSASATIEFTHWPALPQDAGICVYPGRTRELHNEGHDLDFTAVTCCLPRPNQAFWTLSALWSAWVWGKETSAHYSGVLGRRRFDWHWHARALHSTLEAVNHTTKISTPILGLVSNATPGFVLAATSAASAANCLLKGFACKSETGEVQFLWATNDQTLRPIEGSLQNTIRQTIRNTFMALGQPTSYLQPFLATMGALAKANLLPTSDEKLTPEKLNEIQKSFSSILLEKTFVHHFDSVAQEIEPGRWFLENQENCAEPLDDRVEREIVRILLDRGSIRLPDLQNILYSVLPGVLTPDDEILRACLESYADFNFTDGSWHIKPGETPEERKSELSQMRDFLRKTAKRLGYQSSGDQPIIWQTRKQEEPIYRFFLGASAIFQSYACPSVVEQTQSVYVFPGSRSSLIQHKLNQNPSLREMTRNEWHFLKFRYLESLANRPELNQELWMMLLDGDPLSSEKDTQLSIFL